MQVAFVLFPQVTQLDFTGPLQVMHRMPGATTHILARSLDPVPSDCGLGLVPTGTFESAPPIDLLCVPGGYGVSGAVADPVLMDFVRRTAARDAWMTSVCTGAFVLGAAGALEGKRATTHWAYHELLTQVGATPTRARVVTDGKVITGGGVTAGIDFALTVVAALHGDEVAQRIQLGLEYDPAPPFAAGHPDRAPTHVTGALTTAFAKRRAAFAEELEDAMSRAPGASERASAHEEA